MELALTLTASRKGRRRRAIEALERVGLGDQLKKKPNEISGGQMQRVAIARAIVNDPDIVLADEPTGALDSETSKVVMDILKEISKDRLVVMVTHNAELANQYSTRIIRVLDGLVIGDSAPLTDEEVRAEHEYGIKKAEAEGKKKKPTMSFGTSFGLSLKTYYEKRAHGADLVCRQHRHHRHRPHLRRLTRRDDVHQPRPGGHPLLLSPHPRGAARRHGHAAFHLHGQGPVDRRARKGRRLPEGHDLRADERHELHRGAENDLKSFKAYPSGSCGFGEPLREALSGVQYGYDLDLLIYTKNVDGDIIRSDTQQLMQDILLEYMGMDVSAMLRLQEQSFGMNSFSMMRGATLWQELLPGKDGSLINPLLQKQYDLVYGAWPKAYNEIVLVVDENNELDDLTLYALGLKPKSEIDRVMKAAMDKEIIDYDVQKWSYEEICEMDFRTILSSDCYIYDEATGTYVDLRETSAGLKYLYDNGLSLKVSGIIRPNEDAVATMLTGSIGYTYKLTEHAIEKAKDAPAALAQQEDPGTDIFTGLPFKDTDGARTVPEKATGFKEHIASLDEAGKARAYVQIMSIPSPEMVQQAVGQAIGSMARADIEAMMAQALTAQMGISADEIMGYISGMSDEDIRELFAQMAEEQFKAQYAEGVRQQLAAMTPQQLAAALDMAMAQYTDEQCAAYYDEVLVFSDSTYEENLIRLGRVDLDSPATINLYAATFADKDVIEDAIAAYNETVDDLSEIRYTDYVGLMMSSITTIINAITYVLIAFVAVSLIVSSIMIGVITLISVQERTKEIGILRAIGASKKNVSSMFNAETVIIGFTSGALGVLITYLLCIPVNLILHRLTGINNLSAILPVPVALVLVVISMLLTLIAGVIPSRSAAKKDPVVALRTE